MILIYFQQIILDISSSSTGPIAIGLMLSLKRRNKNSFAIERVQATGVVVRDTEGLGEAAAEKVLTLAVVTDHNSHVSKLRYMFL